MKKININIVIMFVVGILVGFVVSYCAISFVDSYTALNENSKKENENNKDEGYVIYFNQDDKKNDNSNEFSSDNNIVDNESLQDSNDDLVLDNSEIEYSDIDVQNSNSVVTPVSYFEQISNSNEENVIKDGFVKIVDFIFYGTEINGYTFNELTVEAKLQVMKFALLIDQKIDEFWPGYKETISNGAKAIYSNVKGFVVELYLDTVSVICESNESVCENAKEDFEFMKKSFGLTWDFIKSLAEAGTDKLKRWYEVFRA